MLFANFSRKMVRTYLLLSAVFVSCICIFNVNLAQAQSEAMPINSAVSTPNSQNSLPVVTSLDPTLDLEASASPDATATAENLRFTREHLNNVNPTGSFDVAPVMFKVSAKPGDVITKQIQVTSRNPISTNYTIEIEDYEGSQDPTKSHVLLGEGESEYGAKHWFTPVISNFDLEIGDRIVFDVDIEVPYDADPGEHYATVLVTRKAVNQEESPGTQVDITSRVGVTFLIDVAGNVEKSGTLESFQLKQNFFSVSQNQPPIKNWLKEQPFDFEITFRNTGSVHLMPSGTIEIKNIFGQTKQVIDPNALRKPVPTQDTLTLRGFNVLRDSVRTISVSSQSDTEAVNLFFGPYTATLLLDNSLGQVSEASVFFWYLPPLFSIIFLIILVILVIVIIVLIRRHRLKRSKTKRTTASQESVSPASENRQFKNS